MDLQRLESGVGVFGKITFSRSTKISLLGGLCLLALVGFQNCAKTTFSTSASLGQNLGVSDEDSVGIDTDTGGANCRGQLRQITTPLRLMFVVDVSGSNRIENGMPGTDPDKVVRGGSMSRFFNTYSSRSNFNWSLMTFASGSARKLVSYGTSSDMSEGLQRFSGVVDNGNTPYLSALMMLRDEIAADPEPTENTKYVVVFLSDGVPNPEISDSNLRGAVRSVVNVAEGRVSFNTVYYGSMNSAAATRLKDMAAEGGGNFLDVNANGTGSSFLISDLVQLPGVICD